MQVGNLVRLTRATIGLPAGSIGLVHRKTTHEPHATVPGWDVLWIVFVGGRACRFLSRDLEVIK